MRVLVFWPLFVLLGTSVVFLAFSSSSFSGHGETATVMVTTIRKLKENSYDVSSTKKQKNLIGFNVEDYQIIDPAPSSKASTNSGPIEHSSPLMPYIPKLTPPSHPKHGGSP